MRTPGIVVANPLRKNPSKMSLIRGDYEIETFPSNGPNQPLAKCIRLGRLRRRSQNPQAKALRQFLVELHRKDRIPIMDEESIRLLARKAFPKLLERPFHRGMDRHIAMQNLSRPDL